MPKKRQKTTGNVVNREIVAAKKFYTKRSFLFLNIFISPLGDGGKSKAMKANIQLNNDPGNGGCCGGGLTDWGCC